MFHTVEGTIEKDGRIHIMEPVTFPIGSHILITILSVQSREDVNAPGVQDVLLSPPGSPEASPNGLVEFFRASPFTELELDFSRDNDTGREVQW